MCLVIKMTHTTTNCQTAVLKSHHMSITLACWQNQVQVNLEDFFFLSFFFHIQIAFTTQSSLKRLWTNCFRDLKLLYIGCIRSCDIAFVPKTEAKMSSE